MTPVSIGLTLVGLVALFWPFATLLFKRNVLDAQWLMMLALTMMALTFLLLGCLFNTFLQGEYLIQILFLEVILITPPVIHIALTVLTQPQSRPLSVRVFFLPSIICIALMILSVAIGGRDMYLLWASRGLQGLSGVFFPHSWRYNLIVAVNFYLFWAVFFFEFLFIFISGTRQYLRFKRINAEYYTTDRFHNLNLKGIYLAANIAMLIMLLSQFTNPFSGDHLILFILTYCLPLAAIAFYIGRSIYMINNSAERIPIPSRSRRDPASLARQIEEYVEKQRAFLNPDLSVFLLAEQFHTTEDDIIDAIHYAQGIPFGDYIDALRVQYALSLLVANPQEKGNADALLQVAHQSGYLTLDALEKAWQRVMHSPIDKSRVFD